MSQISSDTLSQLCHDLPAVDQSKVLSQINKLGITDAARVLGYDLSHYDYLMLAGRLLMFDLQRNTPSTVEEYLETMGHKLNHETLTFMKTHRDRLQAEWDLLKGNDYDYDFFSGHTMIGTYLAKPYFEEDVAETPQILFMRVAIQLYYDEGIERVLEVWREMSQHIYTPASPTLFNAGFHKPSLSSCYLSTISDNIESILYKGVGDQGMISKAKGGIGMDISRIRCSEIGSEGKSKGFVPFVKIYNDMVRAVDQMAMRKGAATLFCRPHHINVFEFCDLVLKVGDHNERAHDINICLWCPWLLKERAENDDKWTLFCPNKSQELNDIWGKAFEEKYVALEALAVEKEKEYVAAREEKKKMDEKVRAGVLTRKDPEYRVVLAQFQQANRTRIVHKVVRAKDLMKHIRSVQRRAGMPYIMFSDAVNMKCNQKNLGYIRCSNLCLEITEFSGEDEIASCNLASLSLRAFTTGKTVKVSADAPLEEIASSLRKTYDFEFLGRTTNSVIRNLNKVIDHNWYPLDQIVNGVLVPGKINIPNKKHRPVGLGISGFAEALYEIDLPFEDERTRLFNRLVFACIYFSALSCSVQLAIKDGAYETFAGSPFSEGKLQFDLWEEEFKVRGPNKYRKSADEDKPVPAEWWGQMPIDLQKDGVTIDTIQPSWEDLKRCVKKYGTRNSLLTCLQPTASTAHALRNCEGSEAHMSNIYSRKVMNGGYPVVVRHLIWDLEALGVWNSTMLEFISASGGSVQKIHTYIQENPQLFPLFTGNYTRLAYVQQKYKTMWELKQKHFLQLAADRGRYIDQSQSTNIYLADPSDKELEAVYNVGDSLGLKTGIYYLRQQPSMEPIKFTVDPHLSKSIQTLNIITAAPTIATTITPVPSTSVATKTEKTEEEKEVCIRKIKDGEICMSCQ